MNAPSAPTGSRWRPAGSSAADRPKASAGRVAAAHAQARPTLTLALVFVAAAAVATAAPQSTGRWLGLHLFLAGGLVLAISGASLLLTVTWAAAPAPPGRFVALQRAAVAVGAAGLAAGRELDAPLPLIGVSGAVFLAGILLLAWLLVTTARQGVQRRFDPAVRWYVAGITSGVAAGLLGIALAGGASVPGDLRAAHVTLNLLGFAGLVIAGTLPFMVPTEARMRLSNRATPARLDAVLAWQAVAVVVAATGFGLGWRGVAAGALVAYAIGILAVVRVLPALGAKQLRWAGPRLVQLLAGVAWWAGAVVATAWSAGQDDGVYGGTTLAVLVVCGFGQVLWGSLAYLLPVLGGGGHERLGAGFRVTRSWPALVAANLAGVALVAGVSGLAAVLIAAWVVDCAVRIVRLRRLA